MKFKQRTEETKINHNFTSSFHNWPVIVPALNHPDAFKFFKDSKFNLYLAQTNARMIIKRVIV